MKSNEILNGMEAITTNVIFQVIQLLLVYLKFRITCIVLFCSLISLNEDCCRLILMNNMLHFVHDVTSATVFWEARLASDV